MVRTMVQTAKKVQVKKDRNNNGLRVRFFAGWTIGGLMRTILQNDSLGNRFCFFIPITPQWSK